MKALWIIKNKFIVNHLWASKSALSITSYYFGVDSPACLTAQFEFKVELTLVSTSEPAKKKKVDQASRFVCTDWRSLLESSEVGGLSVRGLQSPIWQLVGRNFTHATFNRFPRNPKFHSAADEAPGRGRHTNNPPPSSPLLPLALKWAVVRRHSGEHPSSLLTCAITIMMMATASLKEWSPVVPRHRLRWTKLFALKVPLFHLVAGLNRSLWTLAEQPRRINYWGGKQLLYPFQHTLMFKALSWPPIETTSQGVGFQNYMLRTLSLFFFLLNVRSLRVYFADDVYIYLFACAPFISWHYSNRIIIRWVKNVIIFTAIVCTYRFSIIPWAFLFCIHLKFYFNWLHVQASLFLLDAEVEFGFWLVLWCPSFTSPADSSIA